MELDITYEDDVAVNLDFATSFLQPPSGLTATPVAGGGTFAAGTYFYVVTAFTSFGETSVSNEASAVVALNGSVDLAWLAPNGPVTQYKLYRGTVAGAENVLVATIPAGTVTFTDTNVGAAGAPPAVNNALIQDYVLITGYARYLGYTVAETSGANPAWIEIVDNTSRLAESRLAAAASDTQLSHGSGIPVSGFIKVHVNVGVARGTIYAKIPRVNC